MPYVYETRMNGKPGYCAQEPFRDGNGKRYFIRGYGKDAETAARRLKRNIEKRTNAAIQAMRTGNTPENAPNLPKLSDTGTNVIEMLELWLKDRRRADVKESTLAKYRTDIENHVIPYFGLIPLRRLTDEMLEEHFHETLVERGIGSSARKHAFKSTNAMLNTAVRKKLIRENPMANVIGVKHDTKIAVEDQDYNDKRIAWTPYLLRWLSDPENPYHYYYPLALCLFLGLRRGELLGLTWSDLSGITSTVKNPKMTISRQLSLRPKGSEIRGYYLTDSTKNKKPRVIPLPKIHREALKAHRARGIQAKDPAFSGLVFLRPDGSLLTPVRLLELWKEILTAYATKDGREIQPGEVWRLHANRHISAGVLLEQGIAIETIQEILGHSDAAQSLYYAKTTGKSKRAAMKSLDAALTATGKKKQD